MLKNVSKKPFKVSDPELSRIISKIYDDLNDLSSKTNPEFESNREVKKGDIKVVDDIFYFHSGKDWVAIDIDKINRTLFDVGDGGEEQATTDITPLQQQIKINRIISIFWSN